MWGMHPSHGRSVAVIVLSLLILSIFISFPSNAFAAGRVIRLIGGVRLGGSSPIARVTPPSYTGPGDVVPGALAWWGLRAYGAATAGTKAINICRASDSTCEDI